MEMNTYSTSHPLNVEFMKELNLDLAITKNKFGLPVGSLFQVAARKNPKRHFLFASSVIGKYITVDPRTPIVTSLLLSHLFLKEVEKKSPYNEKLLSHAVGHQSQLEKAFQQRLIPKHALTKKTLFIAFAETATGLGHGVFHGVGENATFIHTTRDTSVPLQSAFDFEEEHSHATSHFCFDEHQLIEEAERIVLIDDEITTGNTAINLIQALHDRTPKKEYVVLTILDWRRPHEIQRFHALERSLGVKIHVLSLVGGHVDYQHEIFTYEEEKRVYPSLQAKHISRDFLHPSVSSIHKIQGKQHHLLSGKFGLSYESHQEVENESTQFAQKLQLKRQSKQTLCLGYGEFLFLPNLVASKMGSGISYHSIARSPIYHMNRQDYPLSDAIRFYDPKIDVDMFLYNVMPGKFEEVFLFSEHALPNSITALLEHELAKRGVIYIHFVSLFKEEK